ncbi:MAG: nucleotidyltransferase domain-containing protein [Nanoarchaeota archaeon]
MINKLTSKIILETIRKEKKRLKEKGVKKIGLFGSYAKDKQKKGSDVDFLIEFNEISANNFFGVLFFLEKLLGKKIDLVIEEDLKPELNYVKKEAKYVKI